jgi:ketosteroid isomerase-like protein
MKEQDNTQLVQDAYRAFKNGDIPSFLNILAIDVQWELPEMAGVPFAGSWRGREQVGQFFSKLAEVQQVLEFEPEEFIAQGETVVVLGRFTMRIRATGKVFRSAWAHVWKIDRGSVRSVREYVDTLAVSLAHNERV